MKKSKKNLTLLILIFTILLVDNITRYKSCGIEFAGKTQSKKIKTKPKPQSFYFNKEQLNSKTRDLQSNSFNKENSNLNNEEEDVSNNRYTHSRSRRNRQRAYRNEKYSKTHVNSNRELGTSDYEECPSCMKIKFDFNTIDTHYDFVDFREETTDNKIIPLTNVVSKLKYILDEESSSGILKALNSLVTLIDKSLVDLSEEYCYEEGYKLSTETLTNQVNYDLFIIPVIDTRDLGCIENKDKIWVKYCVQDSANNRPIFALMGFSPYFEYDENESLDDWKSEMDSNIKSTKFNKLFNRILHQTFHLMGFHSDLFSQFNTINGGKMSVVKQDYRVDLINSILYKNTTTKSSDYQYTHRNLYHVALSEAAKSYYNCESSSIFLPLENSGGSGIANMHWESSLFLGEIMTADPEMDDIYISPLTMSFFYNTGWFEASSKNEIHGGKYLFGKDMGCDFIKGSFFTKNQPNYHHFCRKENELGCSPNLKGVGTCNYKKDCSNGSCNENVCGKQTALHYIFTDRNMAGDYCLNDNIPFYKPDFTTNENGNDNDYIYNCRSSNGNKNTSNLLNTSLGDSGYLKNSEGSQACFYHNFVINNDHSSKSSTILDFTLKPSCFNYKCNKTSFPYTLSVCLPNDPNNNTCYQCQNMTKADGTTVNAAFVRTSHVSNGNTYEGYVLCPPVSHLCQNYCKTIYECIFESYSAYTETNKLNNKLSLLKQGGLNQCCSCCSKVDSTMKKASHCLELNPSLVTCASNINNCCSSVNVDYNIKTTNCSYDDYCLTSEYFNKDYNNNLTNLLCCSESDNIITNCSTYKNCTVFSSGYPCGLPFNYYGTSAFNNCLYQRPICNIQYNWTEYNSNCVNQSSPSSSFGFSLPLMRKCSAAHNATSNCSLLGSINIANYYKYLSPCEPGASDTTDCFDASTDNWDLSSLDHNSEYKALTMPECLIDYASNVLSQNERYPCIHILTDPKPSVVLQASLGFEVDTSKGSICNSTSVTTNCITKEYFDPLTVSKFNLSETILFLCDTSKGINNDCVMPVTSTTNYNQYSYFKPNICCPKSLDPQAYNNINPLSCVICDFENNTVTGVLMPFFRKCNLNKTSNCLKIPDNKTFQNIYNPNPIAPHQKYICYNVEGLLDENDNPITNKDCKDLDISSFLLKTFCTNSVTQDVIPDPGETDPGTDTGTDPGTDPENPVRRRLINTNLNTGSCTGYTASSVCCTDEYKLSNPSDDSCLEPCIVPIKKCSDQVDYTVYDDFCNYDPENTIMKGFCKSDATIKYQQFCYNEIPKFCCPPFIDLENTEINYSSYYGNLDKCSNEEGCIDYILPCCDTETNEFGISFDRFECTNNNVCVKLTKDQKLISPARKITNLDVILPICNDNIDQFCLTIDDASTYKVIKKPSQVLLDSNSNENKLNKKLICCDADLSITTNRNFNCFVPIDNAFRNSYCKMTPSDHVPVCGLQDLALNLNCNDKVIVDISQQKSIVKVKYPCCLPDFSNAPCSNFEYCSILPCCDFKDSNGDYVLFLHGYDGQTPITTNNCITPNNSSNTLPTNCYISKPCCTTKFSTNLSNCYSGEICFPNFEKCGSDNQRNCIKFVNSDSSNASDFFNSNWCSSGNSNCSLPNKHHCIKTEITDFSLIIKDNIADVYIVDINDSDQTDKFCFKSYFTTFIPPNCPAVYSDSTRVENCIYNYDTSINYKSQLCCNTTASITDSCFSISSGFESENNYCYEYDSKVQCCLPIDSKTIPANCSLLNTCINKYNICTQSSPPCIRSSYKCSNNYNILGSCHNLDNSFTPTACSEQNVTNCVVPLRCCDNYTKTECSNLSNCMKPLPTCDESRGLGPTEFTISDEIPCMLNGFPINISNDHPFNSPLNKDQYGNFITYPAEFDIAPCCSTTSSIIGCVDDPDYCIKEMRCCYKTIVDELYNSNKVFVFSNNCSNAANCHEAGPCKCEESNPVSDTCKYLFNVSQINDSSEFCYQAQPYCGTDIDYNDFFEFVCCDNSMIRTNCLLYPNCTGLEIKEFNKFPDCSNSNINNQDYCFQQFDPKYLISFFCCNSSITSNCIYHKSCNEITLESYEKCSDVILDNCYVGSPNSSYLKCCNEYLDTNCIKDSTGFCSNLDFNSLAECVEGNETYENCYKGNYISLFSECTGTKTTECIRVSGSLTIPLFLNLAECENEEDQDCYVGKKALKKDLIYNKCCSAVNDNNCVISSFCKYPDITKEDIIDHPCLSPSDTNCIRGVFTNKNFRCCGDVYTYDCILLDDCSLGISLVYYKEELEACSASITKNCYKANSTGKTKYDILSPQCCNTYYTDNCIQHSYCEQFYLLEIDLCDINETSNCYKGKIEDFECSTNSNDMNKIILSSCTNPLDFSVYKSLQKCSDINATVNCYNIDDTLNSIYDLVSISCCLDGEIEDNCLFADYCYQSISQLEIYQKGENENNCLYMNCDPVSVKGISDNSYPCCDSNITTNCTTLDNCVQAAPCKISGTYDIHDASNKHPVNDYSTFTANCFTPRPCCQTTEPAFPSDCNQEEVSNELALIYNSILLKSYKYYNSYITSAITENILYNTNGSISGYYFPIGKTIKELKGANLVHRCIATDFKKEYSCCSKEDPEISTNCHSLTNCIKPKKCPIDFFNNDFIFPGSDDIINFETEDPRNCYKPKACCSSSIITDCSEDTQRCVPVAYPCCGTGLKGQEVVSNCHSLQNCVFPKPCCSSGKYSLKHSNNTPKSYPPECNNLENCFPPKPCCNVNNPVQTGEVDISNKKEIKNFGAEEACPFGSPPFEGKSICDGTWKIDHFPEDCRYNFGDISHPEEVFTITKSTAEGKPLPLSGDKPTCIKTLRCCSGSVSSNCHNLSNCHGYYDKTTKKTSNIKCWTDYETELNITYQATKYVDHPYCKKGVPCCKNPYEGLLELDPNIYTCDNTMNLISNSAYDPSSTSNCSKTKTCCSPDYLPENHTCSYDINCFPIAYPKNSGVAGEMYFRIKPEYYVYLKESLGYDVTPQFYLESTPKVNAYISFPCCEPGKDSTILKPCSIDSAFCIPEMPCCSDSIFDQVSSKTTNNSPYGCVVKERFFNCLDVSPKCTTKFKASGCSDLYNTWEPIACSKDRYIVEDEFKVEDDPTFKKYIFQYDSSPNKNCISRLPCCTDRYTSNCHNLVDEDGKVFCYPENYKCIENSYELANLKFNTDENRMYSCSTYPNAIDPIPCCTEELQSNCTKVNTTNFTLDIDYGCIPPMPCCKEGINSEPCHNLNNCQPPKPCCMFENNINRDGNNKLLISYTTSTTKACTGCELGKFTEQLDTECCHQEINNGCTTDKEKTLNYLLCPTKFPNLSILSEDVSGCLDKLPCCSEESTEEDVPENCSRDSDECSDDNRPCCVNDFPKGCKSTSPCKSYLEYCGYYDYPIIKYTSCSSVSNCISLPKPCCIVERDPVGCISSDSPDSNKIYSNFILSNSVINKPPCCINNNVNNGPDNCVIKSSNNCQVYFPCCENGKSGIPLGCVIQNTAKTNCYEFYPVCKVDSKPKGCSEDVFECLPQLPCCDKNDHTLVDNCVSDELADYVDQFGGLYIDDTEFENKLIYPYCMKAGPQCGSKYQMPDCSTFSNAYEAIPCCDEEKSFICSMEETCIPQFSCCDEKATDFRNCHNLANCILPAPKCTNYYNVEGCSNWPNAWEPYPCCEATGKFVYSANKHPGDEGYCIKYNSSKLRCIVRSLSCCLYEYDENDLLTQLTFVGLDPLINCHNAANCVPGAPICKCVKGEYIRNDCTYDTSLPNYEPKPCCGTYSNSLLRNLDLTIDPNECSEDDNCIQPNMCCDSSLSWNFNLDECTEENYKIAYKNNCDNLLNCTTSGPVCTEGKYVIKQTYPSLWGGMIQPCVSQSSISYEPYLCDDLIKKNSDSLFLDRCLPKLPCCSPIDEVLSTYPCHNLTGCISQNNWCCTDKYSMNCVNLEIDNSGNPLAGISNPIYVKCKTPYPCCNGIIDPSECVEADVDTKNSTERITPSNCIPPRECCSNYDGTRISNDVECHNLANCYSPSSNYIESFLISNKFISSIVTLQSKGINNNTSKTISQTISNQEPKKTQILNPKDALKDVEKNLKETGFSFDSNYAENSGNENDHISELTGVYQDNTQIDSNYLKQENAIGQSKKYIDEKKIGIDDGSLPKDSLNYNSIDNNENVNLNLEREVIDSSTSTSNASIKQKKNK